MDRAKRQRLEAAGWTIGTAEEFLGLSPEETAKSLTTNTIVNDKLKNILTELRSHFEQIYDSRLVTMVLYGSQARGDADPDSDIDVLVVLKAPVQAGVEIDRTLQIVADLSLQNDEVISCQFMNEEKFTNYQGPLLRNIRKEGILI
ncbi:nucleotidyltransferase domain-containing protein [Microcoleus sp. EPA2]|uniref:nucleotidyltransferase domain-containing protein n=1 Tax=Microcoleus sp. EPA2 TaxID=2841654 RepID=UPI00312B5AB6